jgi:iron complex outermembrane receptor protein
MDFTSITSYNNRDILVVRDATALTASITGGSIGKPESVYTLDAPLDDATKVNGFTQEVRLEGGAGGAQRLRWLIGGFYSTQDRKYNQSLIVNGYQDATGSNTVGLRAKKDELFFSDLAYNLDQFALFGEATWALGRQLDLTGGLRYYSFNEDRDQVFDGIFAHDSTGTKVVSQPGSTKADGIAPRVIASWRASDVLTVNAQVAKGFRLGGINDPLNVPLCTPGDLATFSGHDSWTDESAWNYELGAKSSLMNGRGSLNVSAFYLDIQDLQMVLTAGSCSSASSSTFPRHGARDSKSSSRRHLTNTSTLPSRGRSIIRSCSRRSHRPVPRARSASSQACRKATGCRACPKHRVRRPRRTSGGWAAPRPWLT